MPNASHYTAGWIDTTVHDFLSAIDGPPPSMAYALVTCLDSSFDLPSLVRKSPALQALGEKGEVVGKGLLVSTRHLLAADREKRIFFGFDEVWFFDRREVSPKPKGLVITGPMKITGDTLGRLAEWMQANGCSLGLGDGTGMNFCARLRGLARYLVEAVTESAAEGARDERATASA